jgi:hypothetical protein
MIRWVKENQLMIGSWIALMGVSLIVALVGKATSYHQLAIGILTASAALLGMMLLFEAAWWLAIRTLESPGDNSAETIEKR